MASCTAVPYPLPLPASGPSPCTPLNFGAPTYLQFDLRPLASSYYLCTSPADGSTYALSLCGALPDSLTAACGGGNTSSVQLAGGACLASFGQAANASVTLLEQGLSLAYPGGGPCGGGGGSGDAHFTTLALACAPELAPGVLAVDAVGASQASSCGLHYAARSAAACGRVVPVVLAPLGTTAAVLLGLGAALVAYLVAGTLYNRRVRGARGLEALPHIALARQALHAITCGRCCSSSSSSAGGGLAEADYGELKQEPEYFSS